MRFPDAKKSNSLAMLADLAGKLRTCLKAEAVNIYAIGKLLTDAHKIIEHGKWLPWLEDFGINERSARNYLLVHKFKLSVAQLEAFKSARVSDLKLRPTVIYELARLLSELKATNHSTMHEYEDSAVDGCIAVDITLGDVEAVLLAAKDSWVGPVRLDAILRERHPTVRPAEQPADDTAAEASEDEEAGDESESTPRRPRARKPEPELPPRLTAQLKLSSYVDGIWDLCEEAPGSLTSSNLELEKVERVIEVLKAVLQIIRARHTRNGSVEIPIDEVKSAHEAMEPVA